MTLLSLIPATVKVSPDIPALIGHSTACLLSGQAEGTDKWISAVIEKITAFIVYETNRSKTDITTSSPFPLFGHSFRIQEGYVCFFSITLNCYTYNGEKRKWKILICLTKFLIMCRRRSYIQSVLD